MPIEEIRRWLRREPFRPFRIWILEQTSYAVNHPEMIILRLVTVEYFVPALKSSVAIASQRITIAVRHISKLEMLPPTASPSGTNGNMQ